MKAHSTYTTEQDNGHQCSHLEAVPLSEDQPSTRDPITASRKAIRVGLILRDRRPPRWIHDVIEQLRTAAHLKLAAIVLSGSLRPSGSLPASIRLWIALEELCLHGRCSDIGRPRELDEHRVEMIRMTTSDDLGTGSIELEISRIRSLDLDLLIDLGSGQLPDELTGAARYGVWTVDALGYAHQQPERVLLSILSAGHRTYELVLRAVCKGSRNHVLYHSSFSTHRVSLYKNLVADRERRAQILLRRISDLFDRGWDNVVIEGHESDHPGPESAEGTRALFLTRWFARLVWHVVTKLCFVEQWMIMATSAGRKARASDAASASAVLVAPAAGQNYADPFLFERDGKTCIFFEKWKSGRKGAIWCAEVGPDGIPTEAREVLARDYHLSYPFVFEWRGGTYMLPETERNRTVEVYRAVDFPLRWELAAVLLRDVTAVDPTIFEYNGKLWLFVAGIGGTAMYSNELSLFFSDSLFGEWHPHPKNPIVCDVHRARPAGALVLDSGVLIRPGQDCSKRYGYAVSLNRVEVLSETDYREVPIATISPNWLPGILATHTWNRTGDIRVLDGLRRIPRFSVAREMRLPFSLRISI